MFLPRVDSPSSHCICYIYSVLYLKAQDFIFWLLVYLIQLYLKFKYIFIMYLKYIADECIRSAVVRVLGCHLVLPRIGKRMTTNSSTEMISYLRPRWLAHFIDHSFMWRLYPRVWSMKCMYCNIVTIMLKLTIL